MNQFITAQLHPSVDARIFEIVSYAVLKAHYCGYTIYWGWSPDSIQEDVLVLYKTGRTNANDGGIDFVMKPLGRFFQVTETIDVRKFFLDIEKIQRFPLTFVIKSEDSIEVIQERLKAHAKTAYGVNAIVERYMGCIEEIINIPELLSRFEEARSKGKLKDIMDEIVVQSMVEFNFEQDPAKPGSTPADLAEAK